MVVRHSCLAQGSGRRSKKTVNEERFKEEEKAFIVFIWSTEPVSTVGRAWSLLSVDVALVEGELDFER